MLQDVHLPIQGKIGLRAEQKLGREAFPFFTLGSAQEQHVGDPHRGRRSRLRQPNVCCSGDRLSGIGSRLDGRGFRKREKGRAKTLRLTLTI